MNPTGTAQEVERVSDEQLSRELRFYENHGVVIDNEVAARAIRELQRLRAAHVPPCGKTGHITNLAAEGFTGDCTGKTVYCATCAAIEEGIRAASDGGSTPKEQEDELGIRKCAAICIRENRMMSVSPYVILRLINAERELLTIRSSPPSEATVKDGK